MSVCFQLPSLVRRCRFSCALCITNIGPLEVAREHVAAIPLDGHKGWVLHALFVRHDGDVVGVLSVGKVLFDVVASPEYCRPEALQGPEEGGLLASHYPR